MTLNIRFKNQKPIRNYWKFSVNFMKSIDFAEFIQLVINEPLRFKDKMRNPKLYEVFEIVCGESAEDFLYNVKTVKLSIRKKCQHLK